MCKVSEKLKLCTCTTPPESLKHYWILHRFSEEQHLEVMGTTMMPFSIDPETDKFNINQLLNLLNDGNPFDTEITLQEKDRLEISFTIGSWKTNIVTYGFEYSNHKWQEEPFDSLAWMYQHNEEQSGKIKNALQRKSK